MELKILGYYEDKKTLNNLDNFFELFDLINEEKNQLNFIGFIDLEYIRKFIIIINKVNSFIETFGLNSNIKKMFFRKLEDVFSLGFNENNQDKYDTFFINWKIFLSTYGDVNIDIEDIYNFEKKLSYLLTNIVKNKNLKIYKSTIGREIIKYFILRYITDNFEYSQESKKIDNLIGFDT